MNERPNETAKGTLAILLFTVVSAITSVVAANWVQVSDPIVFMNFTVWFFIGAVLTLNRKSLTSILAKVKLKKRSVWLVNLSTMLAWLGYYISHKFIEPAIADTIALALIPIMTIFLWKWLRPQHQIKNVELFSSTGLVFSVAYLCWTSWSGKSAVGDIHWLDATVAIGSIFMSGLSNTANTVLSKDLSEGEFSSLDILSVRMWMLFAFGILWAFLFPQTSWLHLNLEVLAKAFFIGCFGFFLAMILVQEGIRRIKPFAAASLFAVSPMITYGMQYFDSRLDLTTYSLIGIVSYVVFAMLGIFFGLRSSTQS